MSDAVKKVQELMKLPQHLCHTCGKCCRIAIFKGGFSYDEVKELAESKEGEESQIEGAKDFLAIFKPYDSAEKAKKIAPEFVEEVVGKFGDKITFFHCKFIGDDNLCKIHEDRPMLCRMYPIPHERTLYIEGCGFKEQGIKNWQEIKNIIADLEAREGQ